MKIKATQVDPETHMVQRVLFEDGKEASMSEAVQMFKEGKLERIYKVNGGPFGEFLSTIDSNFTSLIDLPRFN